MGFSFNPPPPSVATTITLDQVLANSGIVPVDDGVIDTGLGIANDGSITTKSGIIVAPVTDVVP